MKTLKFHLFTSDHSKNPLVDRVVDAPSDHVSVVAVDAQRQSGGKQSHEFIWPVDCDCPLSGTTQWTVTVNPPNQEYT